MKFATSILLGFLAISAAQGKSLDLWEQKIQELEIEFGRTVDDKGSEVIDKVKAAVRYAQEQTQNIIQGWGSKINASNMITSALNEIEDMKLNVDLECYKTASKDMYAAQEAAITNLMDCKNFLVAYQDIDKIAQNATVVINDVVKDAKVIVEGVTECEVQVGFAKWECVFKYVAKELVQLVSQWSDAKTFIAVAHAAGEDIGVQIKTCMADPTQQALEKKVQDALAEFSACSQKSASHIVS